MCIYYKGRVYVYVARTRAHINLSSVFLVSSHSYTRIQLLCYIVVFVSYNGVKKFFVTLFICIYLHWFLTDSFYFPTPAPLPPSSLYRWRIRRKTNTLVQQQQQK